MRDITRVLVKDINNSAVLDYHPSQSLQNTFKPAAKADLFLRYGNCVA
jgi:hypothetical protein